MKSPGRKHGHLQCSQILDILVLTATMTSAGHATIICVSISVGTWVSGSSQLYDWNQTEITELWCQNMSFSLV